MKKMACLLLSLVLLCCALPAAMAQETYSMGGLTYSLPEGFSFVDQKDDGMFAQRTYMDGDTPVKSIVLCASINDNWGSCEQFGVTMDWLLENLDGESSDYVVDCIADKPTLIVQYTDDNNFAHALIACRIDGQLVVGYEGVYPSQYKAGQRVLQLMMDMAGDTRATMLRGTDVEAEETGENSQSALPSSYAPEDYPDQNAGAKNLITHLSDGYHFCALPWDADMDTVLKTIAATTNRTMKLTGNGEAYMGSGMMEIPELGCGFALCTVTAQGKSWWMECQLVPDGAIHTDPDEALQWFAPVLKNAQEAFSGFSGGKIILFDAADTQYDGPSVSSDADDEEISALLKQWKKRTADADKDVVKVNFYFENMKLSLEKQPYNDGSIYCCWLSMEAQQ